MRAEQLVCAGGLQPVIQLCLCICSGGRGWPTPTDLVVCQQCEWVGELGRSRELGEGQEGGTELGGEGQEGGTELGEEGQEGGTELGGEG